MRRSKCGSENPLICVPGSAPTHISNTALLYSSLFLIALSAGGSPTDRRAIGSQAI